MGNCPLPSLPCVISAGRIKKKSGRNYFGTLRGSSQVEATVKTQWIDHKLEGYCWVLYRWLYQFIPVIALFELLGTMWNDTFQKFKKLGTPLWKMRQLIAWPLGPRLALGPRISSVVRFSRLWHLPCWAKVAWHLPTAIVISTVEYWRCEDPYRPGKNTSRCWGFQVGN